MVPYSGNEKSCHPVDFQGLHQGQVKEYGNVNVKGVILTSINPFTATSRDRATMLNSHRDSHERGEAQLQESERISPKFQLEPEI